MERTDFRGDAEDKRQDSQNERQRHRAGQQQLHDQTTTGEQRRADYQAFEEAFVRRIKPGNIAAGGNEGKKQAQMELVDQQADGHGQTQHQRLTECVVDLRVINQSAPHR